MNKIIFATALCLCLVVSKAYAQDSLSRFNNQKLRTNVLKPMVFNDKSTVAEFINSSQFKTLSIAEQTAIKQLPFDLKTFSLYDPIIISRFNICSFLPPNHPACRPVKLPCTKKPTLTLGAAVCTSAG